MLIIPEIETVVITPPRCGSTSVRNAVLKNYPKAMSLYRHMEADGVPHGYDRWSRICLVRRPLDRLWSVYKYMQQVETSGTEYWRERMHRASRVPFYEWILHNNEVFTEPYSREAAHVHYPYYHVLHRIPENRKSLYIYARPDLGTRMASLHHPHVIEDMLGIKMPRVNRTKPVLMPEVSDVVYEHIRQWFAWDMQFHNGEM